MSESAPKMTQEAKEYRAKIKQQPKADLLDQVSDLTDGYFDNVVVTKNNRLQYAAGATQKGSDGAEKSVAGKFASQNELEDIVAFENQIRLGVKAKEVAPALEVIDTAVAAAQAKVRLMNESSKNKSTLKEVAVIRKAIVESGTMSALEVGKLSDDEITELISYARMQNESPEPAVDADDTLDKDEVDTYFGKLPFTRRDIDAFFDRGSPLNEAEIDAYFASKNHNEPLNREAIDGYFASKEHADDDPIGTHDTSGDSPELLEKYQQLTVAREAWAKISAKRQRRAIDRGTNDSEYIAARDSYQALVREYGRMKLAAQLEAAENNSAKNLLAITYLAEEQNALRDIIKHDNEAKWVNKFSNWMNKGSRKQRIIRGVLVGVAAGAVGGFLGAAGAGIAGAAVVGGARFARGYTMRHPEGMDKLDENFATNSNLDERTRLRDGNDHFDYLADQYDDKFESDTKKEQGKRRKAFAYGAGSVAVGTALGYGIHLGVDHFIGGHEASAAGVHDTGDADQPGYDTGADSDLSNTPVDIQDSNLHEFANAHNVYNVHSGEGWYETFKDMGIPKEEWAGVLKDAGPKLHEQGWAYFDNTHNEWRISQPGKLPEGVVETLKQASAEHGFSFK